MSKNVVEPLMSVNMTVTGLANFSWISRSSSLRRRT